MKAILKHSPKCFPAVKVASSNQKFNFSNLESTNSDHWVVGIEDLMNYSDTDNLTKNPFSLNESLKISSLIMNFLDSDNNAILQAIINLKVIPYLLSIEVLHLNDVFGLLLELLNKDITEEGKDIIQEFITTIKENHSDIDIVELVFSSVKKTNIPNIGKNRSKKIRWLISVNKSILKWFLENRNPDGADAYFAQYANVQFCMSKLMQLLHSKLLTVEFRELIINSILVIYESNNVGVLRSLETFDAEISKMVRDRIHPNNQKADSHDHTMTLEDEKSNVFDVSQH